MNKGPEIPAERKALYYLGAVLMGAGFLLFISNFFMIPRDPFMGRGDAFGSGMAFRGVGGMLLIIAGGFLRSLGARGAAGSGLVLDPQQAREDLEPWARAAGGLVKDALEEVRPGAAGSTLEKPPEAVQVVKVRCPKCRTLNDEDARFCKGCGAPL